MLTSQQTPFDQHAINSMTLAVRREMLATERKLSGLDTLFMGGLQPSTADRDALARFGLNKNWQVIFPAFDPADPSEGPIDFHVVVPDGLTQAFTMSGGRLWKRDRRSAAILIFPQAKAIVRMSSKGRLVVGEMHDRHHDHGYDLAREALVGRARKNAGLSAVIAPIGGMVTVWGLKTVTEAFELAA